MGQYKSSFVIDAGYRKIFITTHGPSLKLFTNTYKSTYNLMQKYLSYSTGT